MNRYQQKLIKEHSDLVIKIQKLAYYLYNKNGCNDDKIEFANKSLQLHAMRNYEEAINARLVNAGIVCEEGQYFEHVGKISEDEYGCDDSENDAERHTEQSEGKE